MFTPRFMISRFTAPAWAVAVTCSFCTVAQAQEAAPVAPEPPVASQPAKPKPPPYSLPWQLRPVAPGNVVRLDSTYGFYKNPTTEKSGSALVTTPTRRSTAPNWS